MKKLLIIGHARHGKDTVAGFMDEIFGLKSKASSMAASEIFLYEALKEKFGYKTPEECFEDRVNHRALWHDMICEYNKDDKARLAKDILKDNDIYTGMRSNVEVEECLRQGVFDLVIGVYDPRKPLEPRDSFDIDMWEKADVIIPNSEGLAELQTRVRKLGPMILNGGIYFSVKETAFMLNTLTRANDYILKVENSVKTIPNDAELGAKIREL